MNGIGQKKVAEDGTETIHIVFTKSQIALVVGTCSVIFGLLTFLINYVDKQTVGKNQPNEQIVSILENQTAILNRLETKVTENNTMLSQRTPAITSTATAVQTSQTILLGINQVLAEQTKVLQKLAVWLDYQIAAERRTSQGK